MKTIVKIPLHNPEMNEIPGTEKAPDAIIRELGLHPISENGQKKTYLQDSIEIGKDPSLNGKNIESKIRDKKDDCIIIGGDHSISLPCIKGFASNFARPGIILIDAHSDCEDIFVAEDQKDLLRGMIEERIISPDNIMLIGTRSYREEEIQMLREHGIKIVSMRHISSGNISDIIDSAIKKAMTWDSVYISVDIDAVDPAFAPGTGCTEPGGLTSREIIYILQRFRHLKNLKMVDLVEINPEIDINEMTVKLGARIVTELL